MKVSANLSWLTPGRVGGSEEYTVRLLQAVIRSAPSDIELRLVGSVALRDAYPDLAAVPFATVGGPMSNRAFRLAVESTAVHRLTRGADVVHHFGGRIPLRHHRDNIVTIHDLQPLHLPANFSSTKRAYLSRALPRTARAASLICVPSEWVAASVVADLGVPAEQVVAISSTYDSATDVDTSIADALGTGPVVLFPAVTHPHKNHSVLLDAMDQLAGTVPDLTLVLTGGEGRAAAAVDERVERAVVRVVRPGRVSAGELRGLMSRADVLAFPSRYEGFGLPVLEAMRAGTAVVASDVGALPEVLGEAGALVAPDDIDGWTTEIGARLSQRSASESEAADQRVAFYSPEAAAARLIDAWRRLD